MTLTKIVLFHIFTVVPSCVLRIDLNFTGIVIDQSLGIVTSIRGHDTMDNDI